ncbi:MAG: PorT family protein [Gemmatimonadota bacterium]|nr:MAG: PorT family protein [Gemmatimonadota bacterium]
MKMITTVGVGLLLIFACIGSVRGQQVSLGVRGGFSGTTAAWDGEEPITMDWNSDFHIGGLVKADLHELFAIQLEAWYARKGTGAEFTDADAVADYSVAYLEVPLLAKLRIPTGSAVRVSPHLFAGPAVAFELSCNISGIVMGIPLDDDCEAPGIGIERKTTDVSLLFGGGLEIQMGPGAVMLDALYDLGLRNLNDDPELPDDAVKNRVFMVSVGYVVPIGGR